MVPVVPESPSLVAAPAEVPPPASPLTLGDDVPPSVPLSVELVAPVRARVETKQVDSIVGQSPRSRVDDSALEVKDPIRKLAPLGAPVAPAGARRAGLPPLASPEKPNVLRAPSTEKPSLSRTTSTEKPGLSRPASISPSLSRPTSRPSATPVVLPARGDISSDSEDDQIPLEAPPSEPIAQRLPKGGPAKKLAPVKPPVKAKKVDDDDDDKVDVKQERKDDRKKFKDMRQKKRLPPVKKPGPVRHDLSSDEEDAKD